MLYAQRQSRSVFSATLHACCATRKLAARRMEISTGRSGDGTMENVGIEVSGKLQCDDCRQKFDTARAKLLHCQFTHGGAVSFPVPTSASVFRPGKNRIAVRRRCVVWSFAINAECGSWLWSGNTPIISCCPLSSIVPKIIINLQLVLWNRKKLFFKDSNPMFQKMNPEHLMNSKQNKHRNWINTNKENTN